jgi:uncharacterized protein with PIN domain
MANRMDPCTSCHAMNVRDSSQPAPERCPRCDAPLLRVSPRTGRFDPAVSKVGQEMYRKWTTK